MSIKCERIIEISVRGFIAAFGKKLGKIGKFCNFMHLQGVNYLNINQITNYKLVCNEL